MLRPAFRAKGCATVALGPPGFGAQVVGRPMASQFGGFASCLCAGCQHWSRFVSISCFLTSNSLSLFLALDSPLRASSSTLRAAQCCSHQEHSVGYIYVRRIDGQPCVALCGACLGPRCGAANRPGLLADLPRSGARLCGADGGDRSGRLLGSSDEPSNFVLANWSHNTTDWRASGDNKCARSFALIAASKTCSLSSITVAPSAPLISSFSVPPVSPCLSVSLSPWPLSRCGREFSCFGPSESV